MFVETAEGRVEIGVFLSEGMRFFKEGLGGDGEEFGVVGGGVRIKDGVCAAAQLGTKILVFLGEDFLPEGNGFDGFSGRDVLREERGAVRGAVFVIQEMGEFMEDEVVAVRSV